GKRERDRQPDNVNSPRRARAVYVGIHRRSDCASWRFGFRRRVHSETVYAGLAGPKGAQGPGVRTACGSGWLSFGDRALINPDVNRPLPQAVVTRIMEPDKPSILIIDDDEQIRGLLNELLGGR